MTTPFWEDSAQVTKFAAREPDKRLMALLEKITEPAICRVLDLGCAGGRNTVVLAERGFDFHAVDTSEAMVRHTRERVARFIGSSSATDRVRVARMDDLSTFSDGCFDLIVALGVYHNAASDREFVAALRETARVANGGATLLVANFDPRTDPTGSGVQPVPGEPHAYDGFPSGRVYLLGSTDLDAAFGRSGFHPFVASETVSVETERGTRVTVNATYQKG